LNYLLAEKNEISIVGIGRQCIDRVPFQQIILKKGIEFITFALCKTIYRRDHRKVSASGKTLFLERLLKHLLISGEVCLISSGQLLQAPHSSAN